MTASNPHADSPARNASEPGGFASEVYGTQPKGIDREIPALLQDLYAVTGERRGEAPAVPHSLPSTWQRLDDAQLQQAGINATLLYDKRSGFDAAFYRNDQGNVVLAYCGTDELKDWKHNIGQGLGFDDPQYDAAIALAQKAKTSFGDNVVLAGHSLGGGLASAASMLTEIPAVTYNAAGVHDATIERYDFDADVLKRQAADGLIRGYHVKNEILTHVQEDSIPLKWAMPDGVGHRIELPDPDPLSFGERLIPGKMLMHRLDLHGIESVMQAQSLQQSSAAEPQRGFNFGLDPSNLASSAPPSHPLFGQASAGLAPYREQLGLHDDQRFFNAAANLAAHAGDSGLERIDHVLPSRQGERMFAVQGSPDDPTHRRVFVDTFEAAATPAAHSTAQLQEQARANQQTTAQEQAEPQLRRALGY